MNAVKQTKTQQQQNKTKNKQNLPKDWHLETSLSIEQTCFKGTTVVCVCVPVYVYFDIIKEYLALI